MKSKTPTATSALNVLDCVAVHGMLRMIPKDLAKFSCETRSSYVGPLYPALHVQFQMVVAPVPAALVGTHGTHAVHTVMPSPSASVELVMRNPSPNAFIISGIDRSQCNVSTALEVLDC